MTVCSPSSDRNVSVLDAFRSADQVLLSGVQGITDLITTPGLINLDFADVKSVMQGAGSALMGIGSARAKTAPSRLPSSPSPPRCWKHRRSGAHGVLLSIQGGSDLGLFEINEGRTPGPEVAHPEANIIFGAVIDDALGDEARVTVIAAGFDDVKATSPSMDQSLPQSAPQRPAAPAAARLRHRHRPRTSSRCTPQSGASGYGGWASSARPPCLPTPASTSTFRPSWSRTCPDATLR